VYDSGHPEDVELLIACYLQISDPFAKKHILILDLNKKKRERERERETEEIKDEHKILK